MEKSYIEEKTWVKCTIDGITYDCHFEHKCSVRLSKPWVEVTVIKNISKKCWFFKWTVQEFEANDFPDLINNEWEWVNKTLYFKSEYIMDWVKGALNRREEEIREKKSELEKQKNLKVLKEI